MSRALRRFLLAQALTGAGINALLNGAIAWWGYRAVSQVPLFGPRSIAGDLAGTAFLLPLLVSVIAMPLVRAEPRQGRTLVTPLVAARAIADARPRLGNAPLVR